MTITMTSHASLPYDHPERVAARKKLELEAAEWQRRKDEKAERELKANSDFKAHLAQMSASLPDRVVVPYASTPEGQRAERFRRVFDDECEFTKPIDRLLLKNPDAFDRVAQWDGSFPGPLATGSTGTAKTRAAVTAIERLFVKHNRPFTFFPVQRLLAEFTRYEKKEITDEFYRMLSHYPVLLIDDLDKINWQFESQTAILFSFYDWIYRAHRPVITTTNQNEAWWKEHAGPAFTRRLFQEAHFTVKF